MRRSRCIAASWASSSCPSAASNQPIASELVSDNVYDYRGRLLAVRGHGIATANVIYDGGSRTCPTFGELYRCNSAIFTGNLGALAAAVGAVTGVTDIIDCAKGKLSACGWAVAGLTPAGKIAKAAKAAKTAKASKAAKAEVRWIDEAAAMSDDAARYQAGAFGARSNALTRAGQAPELNGVRFDGFDARAGVLIDRKLAVTTFPKSQQQALCQSEALAAGGYRGRWEVPTAAEAARATRMFRRLGVSNIDVSVVPR